MPGAAIPTSEAVSKTPASQSLKNLAPQPKSALAPATTKISIDPAPTPTAPSPLIFRKRWVFAIRDTPWVDGLSHRDLGPDLAIVRDEEDAKPPQFFFASQHLEDLEQPADVRARGLQLFTLLMGAMYLNRGTDFCAVPLGELINWEEDRRVGFQEPSSSVTIFSPRITTAPFETLSAEEAPRLRIQSSLWLARSDEIVRGMLTTLGLEGVTYRSLYALRDFMKTAGMTDDDIRADGGTSSAAFTTFTRTANSYAAVGPAARHGLMNTQPPASPMGLEDSARIILPAARKLIDRRALDAV